MTDRELLEAAARAAGHKIRAGGQVVQIGHDKYFIGRTEGKGWDPFQSNADAFRLMVDCEVEARFCDDVVTCRVYGKNIEVTERAGTNKHAATRRAIVRAAAAMGESL